MSHMAVISKLLEIVRNWEFGKFDRDFDFVHMSRVSAEIGHGYKEPLHAYKAPRVSQPTSAGLQVYTEYSHNRARTTGGVVLVVEITDINSYDPPFLLSSGEASTIREIRDIWEDVVHSAYDQHSFPATIMSKEYPAESYESHAGIIDGDEYLKVLKYQRGHHCRVKFPQLDPANLKTGRLLIPTRPW